MKRFRVPPGWPLPPGRSWTPPEGWQPDPSWPAPPERWRFWVDAKGKPVPGPIGRYGGVSRRTVSGAAAAAALFVAVNLWALSTVGLLGGSGEDPAGVLADDARTVSTPTPQPPKSISRTPSVIRTETPSGEATPTVTSEVVRPSERPTRTEPPRSVPSSKPTKPRRTDRTTPRWNMPPEYIEQCKRENPEYAWWCDPNHWPR